MQQRQLRLGDILDDYCPRERRLTNHAVVAMIGEDVKQTRCTTCDADHEYKHAKVPRQRRKDTPAALYSQVLAGGPKRVAHEEPPEEPQEAGPEAVGMPPISGPAPIEPEPAPAHEVAAADPLPAAEPDGDDDRTDEDDNRGNVGEGPAHRRLIRATLPRIEGQPPPTRPAPDFTIRQPASRQGRFRPRNQQGGSPFRNDQRGNMGGGGGGMRQGGGNNRPPMMSRSGRRHGPPGGPKRSK